MKMQFRYKTQGDRTILSLREDQLIWDKLLMLPRWRNWYIQDICNQDVRDELFRASNVLRENNEGTQSEIKRS